MINSIQQFQTKGINELKALQMAFVKTKSFTDLEKGIEKVVLEFGRNLMKESLEQLDQAIRDSHERKCHKWEIVRRDDKALTTRLGSFTYQKTLYRNRERKESGYLIDRILGFDSCLKMTELAEACLLEETVESCYRKGGKAVSLLDDVSKETVMNKIHSLDFSRIPEKATEKREVPILYIDADEDHVALQYCRQKGDLKGRGFNKGNCKIAKLVYVYEGVKKTAPQSNRHELINVHYFSGTYEDNKQLWQEVYAYLERTYDLSKIKKVYLNSDGGAWIKGAENNLGGLTKVLDEFHLQKYLTKMVGGLLDSADDERNELMEIIRKGKMEEFGRETERILAVTEGRSAQKRIAESANYILRNWTAARVRLQRRTGICGCSAEGHVSHVLSSRMSSRPLGWSEKGVDKMAHLRAYYFNRGDMLELVRAQRIPKAAGGEKDIILDTKKLGEQAAASWGKYVDVSNHTVSTMAQKYAWFSAGITGI